MGKGSLLDRVVKLAVLQARSDEIGGNDIACASDLGCGNEKKIASAIKCGNDRKSASVSVSTRGNDQKSASAGRSGNEAGSASDLPGGNDMTSASEMASGNDEIGVSFLDRVIKRAAQSGVERGNDSVSVSDVLRGNDMTSASDGICGNELDRASLLKLAQPPGYPMGVQGMGRGMPGMYPMYMPPSMYNPYNPYAQNPQQRLDQHFGMQNSQQPQQQTAESVYDRQHGDLARQFMESGDPAIQAKMKELDKRRSMLSGGSAEGAQFGGSQDPSEMINQVKAKAYQAIAAGDINTARQHWQRYQQLQKLQQNEAGGGGLGGLGGAPSGNEPGSAPAAASIQQRLEAAKAKREQFQNQHASGESPYAKQLEEEYDKLQSMAGATSLQGGRNDNVGGREIQMGNRGFFGSGESSLFGNNTEAYRNYAAQKQKVMALKSKHDTYLGNLQRQQEQAGQEYEGLNKTLTTEQAEQKKQQQLAADPFANVKEPLQEGEVRGPLGIRANLKGVFGGGEQQTAKTPGPGATVPAAAPAAANPAAKPSDFAVDRQAPPAPAPAAPAAPKPAAPAAAVPAAPAAKPTGGPVPAVASKPSGPSWQIFPKRLNPEPGFPKVSCVPLDEVIEKAAITMSGMGGGMGHADPFGAQLASGPGGPKPLAGPAKPAAKPLMAPAAKPATPGMQPGQPMPPSRMSPDNFINPNDSNVNKITQAPAAGGMPGQPNLRQLDQSVQMDYRPNDPKYQGFEAAKQRYQQTGVPLGMGDLAKGASLDQVIKAAAFSAAMNVPSRPPKTSKKPMAPAAGDTATTAGMGHKLAAGPIPESYYQNLSNSAGADMNARRFIQQYPNRLPGHDPDHVVNYMRREDPAYMSHYQPQQPAAPAAKPMAAPAAAPKPMGGPMGAPAPAPKPMGAPAAAPKPMGGPMKMGSFLDRVISNAVKLNSKQAARAYALAGSKSLTRKPRDMPKTPIGDAEGMDMDSIDTVMGDLQLVKKSRGLGRCPAPRPRAL